MAANDDNDDGKLAQRLQRNTYVVLSGALLGGVLWSGWRMALGVLLGGGLSLFNLRWLRSGTSAMLSYAAAEQTGRTPPWTSAKLILRYFVIAHVIGAAAWSGYFHLVGIGIGFAAFVGGVMIEAGYQLCLSFKHEDTANP